MEDYNMAFVNYKIKMHIFYQIKMHNFSSQVVSLSP